MSRTEGINAYCLSTRYFLNRGRLLVVLLKGYIVNTMDFDMASTPIFLVSSCLLGFNSRYDGRCKVNEACLEMTKRSHIVPICPEQLGGLPTPRIAADIVGGNGADVLKGKAKVVTRAGRDVTLHFILGAQQVLKIAQMQNVNGVCLKSRSPSCGVELLGVTSALLKNNGFVLHEF